MKVDILNVFIWDSFKGNSNCSKLFLILGATCTLYKASMHAYSNPFIFIHEHLEINNLVDRRMECAINGVVTKYFIVLNGYVLMLCRQRIQ